MSDTTFGFEQTLAQLRSLGFGNDSRFYGRVLLPRELQESKELRESLGVRWKTIDFFADVVGDHLIVTRLKWMPSLDESGNALLKEDGSSQFKLVPGENYQDGYEILRHWNKWGGVYFYPNQGGRFNRDITACPTAFFESDEGTFEQQWAAINDFSTATGVLPSCVVRTRKSLHVYYRFPESEWTVEGWTEDIQRPLCLAMRSDPAIQNTARLMRLAGFNHVKWLVSEQRLDFVQVSLEICQPERQYAREQLRVAIASVLPQQYSHERFKFWVFLNSPSHKDLGIELDPEIARSCPEAELEGTSRRWRQFIKLSRDKTSGKDVNPQDAFTCDVKKLPRTYNHNVNGDAAPFEGDTNTILWARYLYGYDPQGRGDWITAQDPFIPESDRALHSIDSLHIHKVTGAIKSHRGSDPKDVYERMKAIAEEGVYKELTQMTAKPWKEVDTPNLDLEGLKLERGAIYIVKSAKGTGKTNALVPLIPTFTNVYSIFSRVALGREECNRIKLDWKDDLKTFTGSLKVGFCADSAFTFSPGLLRNNGLLLLDEADQVFEHCFGETCNKHGKRPLILASLKAHLDAAIAGNGMALFMSADITDKEIAYIQQLAPAGCPVRLILNHYQPDLGDVYFYESNTPDAVIESLIKDLEAGEPRFVIDDMRTGVRGCQSIAEYVRQVHPEWASEIVEINSDTSGDPAIIDYLRNINTASMTTRLLCCSPSVVSGVSIENGHFTEVYAFLNGVMTVSHASQAIARVRGAEAINVWAAEEGLIYAGDRSLFPEQIKGYYKRNYESNCKHLLAFSVQYDALKDEWDSPHFALYCKYAAYRNLCMEGLRSRLKQRLEDEGYEILSVAAGQSEVVKAGLQTAWTNLEISHAHAVAAANVLTEVQLDSLENTSLTPQQKLDVEKTYLLKSFGQELVDNMTFEHPSGERLTGFAAMVIKDKRGEYRKQLESFYLLTSDAGVAISKDMKAEQRQLAHGQGRFAGDVRWHTRQRKAREFLGLQNFLNPTTWYGPVDFADLAERAKKHVGRVKDALGFAVGKMSPGQIFGELMSQLGLDLDKKDAPRLTQTGKRYKLRQISPGSWHYAQLYVSYRNSLNQDLETQPEDVAQPVTPSEVADVVGKKVIHKLDHPSGNYSSEVGGGGDPGLDLTGQGIEVVQTPSFSPSDFEEKTNVITDKSQAVSPATDAPKNKTNISRAAAAGVGLVMPGNIVECLGRAGKWTVKYCTGVVAKITDRYGDELVVSAKDLRLAARAA